MKPELLVLGFRLHFTLHTSKQPSPDFQELIILYPLFWSIFLLDCIKIVVIPIKCMGVPTKNVGVPSKNMETTTKNMETTTECVETTTKNMVTPPKYMGVPSKNMGTTTKNVEIPMFFPKNRHSFH